jgi:hypothetical protein
MASARAIAIAAAARAKRSERLAGCLEASEALARSRRKRARSALYLAMARVRSVPHMTATPAAVRTVHAHRFRPRLFRAISKVANRSRFQLR